MEHQLQKRFAFNVRVIKMNLEGISNEESLIKPKPAGNPLNWVVGHIIASRNIVLEVMGASPFWTEELAAPYNRGSHPFESEAQIIPINKLMEDFERSTESITAAFLQLTPEKLASKVGDSTVEDYLFFLYFHEAYHLGQTGILRRLLGKEGAI